MEKPSRFILSVREFAIPSPRSGSIESYSGLSASLEDGQEIHQRIQRERLSESQLYSAEVAFTHTFEYHGYSFEVSGRADGVLTKSPTEIEEIKSTFHLKKLRDRLHPHHPYSLQVRTYGYFHWLQTGEVPELSILLVSSRNGETETYPVPLDLTDYQQWLEKRLSELSTLARKKVQQIEKRGKQASHLQFPFASPRRGQKELILAIEEGFSDKKRLLLQAPTGLGKTIGVMYPTLRDSLTRGASTHYVTPKNSQHSVAEEAIDRLNEGLKKSRVPAIRALTLTSKSKICFKDEPLCDPSHCEFAKEYYDKVAQNDLLTVLEKKKRLDRKVFEKIGKIHEVCPYQLQLDGISAADVVIGDYHYAISSGSTLQMGGSPGTHLRIKGIHEKSNLIIDEVHNLPSRSMDEYSPGLSTSYLKKLEEELLSLPKKGPIRKFQKEGRQLIQDCCGILRESRPKQAPQVPSKGMRIDLSSTPFIEQDLRLRGFLSRYLESDAEILAKDPVLKLCFSWSSFAETLEMIENSTEETKSRFFTTYRSYGADEVKLQVICCDASEFLKPRYEDYHNTVAFSATLKPFDFYSKLTGLQGESLKTVEFASPFDSSNRKIIVIPQVSTLYAQREQSAPRIAEIIARITPLNSGNYFIFFPSFEFLEKVLAQFLPPAGFKVIAQSREMKPSQVEEILLQLRQAETPTLVFAVQGGVFAEGIDTPGKAIIGAFIVGPPLPSFDLEREEMRKIYDRTYARKGFDYAYVYPAMAKAIQAAGRVIRTETDRGLIVLLDPRFLDPAYAGCMPSDWYTNTPRELVSQSILKEISDFWRARELNSPSDIASQES